jgi:hypothetical protein
MPIDISLSIEEIAVAMGAEGDSQVALGILIKQFGKVSKDEMEGRLYSAIHALIAEGRLSSTGDGNVQNSPELREVARILLKADYTVRYQRRQEKSEYFLAYHFLGKKVFEHRLKQKVVHQIKEVTREDVIAGGLDFFGMNNSNSPDFPVYSLPVDALKSLQPSGKTEAMLGYLEMHEIPVEVRTVLVEDIAAAGFRASALRIEYDEKNSPYSKLGFLLLHGSKQNWIFLPENKYGKDHLSLLPGSCENFQRLASKLIVFHRGRQGGNKNEPQK